MSAVSSKRQEAKARLLKLLGIEPKLDDATWEAHLAELDAADARLRTQGEKLLAELTPKERAVIERRQALELEHEVDRLERYRKRNGEEA